ncbi:MAG: histidinol-phosphatase HisJ family protein [Anaerolineae bacterium]|nr:histidinol-phosphatase HisJ family protein [Anaerolineae bacterium]
MTSTIPFDYHMHSNYSCDCRVTMQQMCREAVRKGIPEIAFTEHFNRHRDDICFEHYDPDAFFKGLAEVNAEFNPQGLVIKAGIEVGEMHLYRAEVDAVLNNYPYDVVLGSMHWNHGESIFSMKYFEKREPKAAAREYFEEMLEMVEAGGFDVLSHIDVIKRYAFQVYGRFALAEYEAFVRPVLAACVKQGIIPEINTSALRMHVAQTHPTIEALHWYRELGGTSISIGSDSHNPTQLGTGLDIALSMAHEAGLQLARFSQRHIIESITA